jgi:hypothetical protein
MKRRAAPEGFELCLPGSYPEGSRRFVVRFRAVEDQALADRVFDGSEPDRSLGTPG